jgi:uncharacterized protein YukE
MKFDMGNDTLHTLAQNTGGSQDELTTLVRQLIDSVTPLEGKFNGSGKAAFDSFKSRADEVTHDLNAALASVNTGQVEMDRATQTGDSDTSDNATRAEGSANFDGARFAAR